MAQIIYGGITPGFNITATPAQVTTAGPATVPAASIVNAIYSRDCGASGRTDTFDSTANIIAALPGAVTGTSFDFVVLNSGAANTLTLAAADGSTTFTGTKTVAHGKAKILKGYVTGATTITIQSCDISSTY